MSEFTTIQITKEVRDKLDLCKGENNLTYNQIVEKLLEQSGGTIVEDTIEIQREQVAFTLNFWDDEKQMKTDITYADLQNYPVGHLFQANPSNKVKGKYVDSDAEIIWSYGDEVVLRVSEVSGEIGGKTEVINSIVHLTLF